MLLQSEGLLSKIKRGARVHYSVLGVKSRFNLVKETLTGKGRKAKSEARPVGGLDKTAKQPNGVLPQ